MRPAVGWLGVIAAVGMFVVLIAGSTVTNTGSATGCGQSWPLCGGRFIPEFAVSTAIEFTHRAITGVEGILVVVLAAALLTLYWSRVSARILAVLLVGSIVLQAGMGAWAVMQPQDPWVLALHFGFSLLAFAAAVLAALCAWSPERLLAPISVGGGVRAATWGVGVYLYALVYSGAYVSHAGASAACGSWPLCGASGAGSVAAVAVNLLHRGAAGLALALAVGLVLLYAWRAPGQRELVGGAWALVATILAQGAAGAYLVLSHWHLFGQLLHAGVTAFVFGAVAYLCLRVSLRAPRQAGQVAPAGGPLTGLGTDPGS
jgi:cytochrome c oxidase assembly protein subunit 15